jgi:hypothetical protein
MSFSELYSCAIRQERLFVGYQFATMNNYRYFQFLFLFALSLVQARGATRNWTNTLGGDWFAAANWSPNGVPAGNDIANITISGTYSVTIATGTVSVASFNLGGASGTQTLALHTVNSTTAVGTVGPNGILDMSSGALLGTLVVQPGGQLQFNSTANKFLDTLNLVNQGTVLWNDGQLLNGGQPATVVSNGGQWLITGDASFNAYSAQTNTPVWINSGLLRKSGSTGVSVINNFNVAFTPNGVVDTQTGTLRFAGGTNNLLGGSFTTSSGATLDLYSGTYFDGGGSASGAGINRFDGTSLILQTNPIPGLLLTAGNVLLGPNFQSAGAITNLTLDGATLPGVNSVSGTFLVNSGFLLGQLTIQPGGQLQFNTPANKFLDTLNLVNQGTVLWKDGQLLNGGQPATVVSNGGQWLITGDASINAYSAQTNTPVWINSGLLRKSGGTGVSVINNFNVAFTPDGVVDTQTGTLRFGGGTNNTLGGSFTTSLGATMDLYSGTYYDAGGSASGAGVNRFDGTVLILQTNPIPGLLVSSGTVVLSSTFQNAGTITNLTLDGGTLSGANRVSGTLVVNSGVLLGTLVVQPGGQLQFNTPANKFLDTLNLVNQGTVIWNDGQLLNGGQPATVISNGGQWLIMGDNSINAYSAQTNTPVWINSGLLRKSGGTGISVINNFNVAFTPDGVVDTQTGTLRFGGGTNNILGGSFTTSSGATLDLYSGTYFDGGGSASGAGANRFDGTTLNLRTNIVPGLLLTAGTVVLGPNFQNAGAITNLTLDGATLTGVNSVSGTFLVNSGVLPGQLTVQPSGQLQFNTPANKFLDTLNLVNQGTVLWNDGQLLNGGQPATVVSNGGQWLITGDASFNAYSAQTNTPVWINSGLLRKSGGTGISVINNFNVAFTPDGVVDTQTGTLRFGGGTNNTLGGSFATSLGATLDLYSGTYYDAGGSASGAGANRFDGTTLNLQTNIIPGLLLTGGTIQLGPNFQNTGTITNLTLDGATLTGVNGVSGTFVVNSGFLLGQLTIQSTGQLQFNTPANKFLDTLNLVNQGTVAWNDGQLLNGGQPATVVSNGGQWLITGDNSINPYSAQTNAPVWINSGLLSKAGGTGVSLLNNFNFATQPSGVIQAGTGTLSLPPAINNSAGTLRLNGGTIRSSGTFAMTGGTLEGSGSFGANSISGGILSPGQAGSGLINFTAGLNLSAGATLSMSGTGTTAGSQYDQLSVVGAVSLGNATLQVVSLPAVPAGTAFVLIQNNGADAVTGTFNGLAENSILNVNGQPFRIHYAGGKGNDVTLVRDSGSAGPILTGGTYSNGTFQLFSSGSSGVVYGLQASTNFIQWTNIGFATGTVSGTISFTDPEAFHYSYRFYRTTN